MKCNLNVYFALQIVLNFQFSKILIMFWQSHCG
jgi:hypothetical protein